MHRSSLVAVAMLGLAGCRSCSSSHASVDAGAPADAEIGPPAPLPFTLVAKTPELWAYTRAKGKYVVVRTHDFSRVGAFELPGDVHGETRTGGGGTFPGARFCADGRFAIFAVSPFRSMAAIWSPKDGLSHVATPGSETLGWSDTCELVKMETSDDSKHVTIRLVRTENDEQTFALDAPGDAVGIADVTADALLVALMPQSGPIGARRFMVIDRKTKQSKTLPRTFLSDVSWTRVDSHSFAIAPTFAEGPFVVRADAELDPAAKAAFASRPIPKAALDRDPSRGPDPVAAGVDSTKNVVALYDGSFEMSWWSLSPRRLLETNGLSDFTVSNPGTFHISFTPNDVVTVASTPYGDVAGFALDKKKRIAYAYALAKSVCPGGAPCATGNMATTTTAVVSDDGVRMAVGYSEPPQNIEIVNLERGTPLKGPTLGIPRTFVDGHDKLLVGEEIWSIDEGRVVGNAPD